ncbi:MAG: homocysteine S-methyltransferase family protein [Butyricicoccus sp.]|nr:homocysteine S-methyltransferase family protein [Butyricicoccus sp.]
MDFRTCIEQEKIVLMEGALGERLKREYGLTFDPIVAMAKLIYEEKSAAALTALWNGYIDIARRHHLPFLAATPTRRANRERAAEAGCTGQLLHDNVRFLRNIQQSSGIPMYVGGLMGCRGDAYTGADALNESDARAFHSWQADRFREAGADYLYAGIMPTLPEAAGMAQAMAQTGLPYLISFTIQADGCLIDGTPIAEAIRYIDAAANIPPVCYMTNCVHPRIVRQALAQPCNNDPVVRSRFRGLQANTSPLSYTELDGAKDLLSSSPPVFAAEMLRLHREHPLTIWGGCCGTDHRHLEQLAKKLTQT